jgi:4-amino-4-deoxy-L-arabinose transferase-like glycosyltransferase
MPRRALWSSLLLVAACALYAIDLGRAPIYLHDAEVLFALHAHSIVTTAHDTNGRLLPLYFQMPSIGENVWFHPVIVYWMAPFLGVLPMTEWAVRLPSVLVGMLDLTLIYVIGRRLFHSSGWGLVAAVLLALTPAHFMHSRMAMDYLYPVPFVLAWLLCLMLFLERRHAWLLFLATSFLGVGFYSYIASVIMMPVYLLMTWAVVHATPQRPTRLSAIGLAGFVWPLALLVLWLALHPAVVAATLSRYQLGQVAATLSPGAHESMSELLERTKRAVPFSSLTGRVSLYWYFFDPAYLFLTGGYANVVNSTQHVGVFLAPLLVFVPIGLVRLATRRETPLDALIVCGFLSAPLAACLVVPEPYAVDRELGILPFGVLAATVGVKYLFDRGHAYRKVAICLLAIVPMHFGLFCYEYFGAYRVQSAFWFEFNRRDAIEGILTRDAEAHAPAIYLSTRRIPYLSAYWKLYLIKHGREDLLARTRYFDADTLDVRDVPEGSLLLASREDKTLDALIENGGLKLLAAIPEPGDPPAFAILRRQ